MGKQHDTFPDEPEEIPHSKEQPEVDQPSDPDVPVTPAEDPDVTPDEMPTQKDMPQMPPLK